MKTRILLWAAIIALFSCTTNGEKGGQEHQPTDTPPSIFKANMHRVPELSREQKSALDALATLQVNTDEMNRLYLTFGGTIQPCYPPDTGFTIS